MVGPGCAFPSKRENSEHNAACAPSLWRSEGRKRLMIDPNPLPESGLDWG